MGSPLQCLRASSTRYVPVVCCENGFWKERRYMNEKQAAAPEPPRGACCRRAPGLPRRVRRPASASISAREHRTAHWAAKFPPLLLGLLFHLVGGLRISRSSGAGPRSPSRVEVYARASVLKHTSTGTLPLPLPLPDVGAHYLWGAMRRVYI